MGRYCLENGMAEDAKRLLFGNGRRTRKKTYTKFAKDHPLVLMPYSLFESDRIEPKVMSKTLDRVLKTYDLEEMWGWDFPMMAMCAYHLNRKKKPYRYCFTQRVKTFI